MWKSTYYNFDFSDSCLKKKKNHLNKKVLANSKVPKDAPLVFKGKPGSI